MSTNNPRYLQDGASILLGGVDEGREPLLLRPDQVARATNVTMRGGFPRTRPGYIKRELDFARPEYEEWWENNLFQGYGYYDDFRGMEKVVSSVGGRLFLTDPGNGYLTIDITPRKTTTTTGFTAGDLVTPVAVVVSDSSLIFDGYPVYVNGKEYALFSKSGTTLNLINVEETIGAVIAAGSLVEFLDPNSPVQPLVWMEQAEQYLVIQDDQSRPIIFDGASTRRAKVGIEIPTGSVMAYGRGRLWVATNNGRNFAAGDIVGGPTGVLGFTENTFLFGGGSFRVGASVGRIRSMKFVMNLDTSLGQGHLQVLCDRAIYSVNAPTSRELWSVITDPIQTESLINFGAAGHYSTVLVNGDLFFRSQDGLRSFFIARRDFGTWGNTPISTEMFKTMGSDTPELLINAAAVLFDNRLLFTAVPVPGANGVRHKCLVVLDFDLISTLGKKSPPAYDGFWTGIEVTGLLTGRFAGRPRCFAFAHDGYGKNTFWEITGKERFDNGDLPITSRLEYKSLMFPKSGTGGPAASGLKRLHGAEVGVSEFAGEVTFTLTYKPDQYPCWQDWAEKTICIDSDQCAEEDPCDSTESLSNLMGFKTRIGFGVPADVNNEADEKTMRTGFSFQPALEWSGYAALNKFTVYAHEEEEWAMAPPSDDRTVCGTIQCCPPDPFEYRVDTFPLGATHHWDLDESLGHSRLDDIGGNYLEETILGLSSSLGKLGDAVEFNGDGGLQSAAALPLNFPFTLNLWVKCIGNPSAFGLLFGVGGHITFDSNGNFNVVACAGTGGSFSGAISTGIWHQVTLLAGSAGQLQELWIDGAKYGSNTITAKDADAVLRFSSSDGTGGLVDELTFWPRVLTETEIVNLWSGGNGTFY